MGFALLANSLPGLGMSYCKYYSELLNKPKKFVEEYSEEVSEFLNVPCGSYAHEESSRRLDFMFDLWCSKGYSPQLLNKFWVD